MNTNKTISISSEVYEFLKNQGKKGESFDIVLRKLLNFTNHPIPPLALPTRSKPVHSKPDRRLSD